MITINNSNLPLIDYRILKPLQDELKYLSKDNYKKLLKSIEKNGFFIPAFVWFDEGEPYIVDAHQRQRVLLRENIKFENTGYEIPYIEISAKDKKDAASKILTVSSQYGTITQEGIDNFIATYELPEAEIFEMTNFDGIRFYELGTEVQELDDKGGKSPNDYIGGDELRDSMQISLSFDKASFVEFMTYANYFRELYGAETVTDAIVQAVREKYEDAIR